MGDGTIFVTGATGALGPALLEELLATGNRVVALVRPGHRLGPDDRISLVEGDVTRPVVTDECIDRKKVQVIIHAAADTRFCAPRDQQEQINVEGARNVLAFARQCPHLRRFVLVSTTCVAGTRTGLIGETISRAQPEFVNFYESTKWHAEQLVQAAKVPSVIVRLSTVAGSERDGRIGRLGAIHHALRWLHRGLIPMLPGTEHTPVDLISAELAARCIARCAAMDGPAPEVIQVAAGENAVPLGELLDFLVEESAARSVPWRQRQFRRPLVVDRQTFELFQKSIHLSGDVLFKTVLDSTVAFLPGLLYPKRFATDRAAALLGARRLPQPDWRPWLRRVLDQCIHEPETGRA